MYASDNSNEDSVGFVGRWAGRVAWGLRFLLRQRGFLGLLVGIVLFKGTVADLSSISGDSMLPTLVDGDKIWVNKLAYDVRLPFSGLSLLARRGPQRGDIVIIDSEQAGKRLVKRIIGLPGDTLRLQDNALIINGVAAEHQILTRDAQAVIILEHLPAEPSAHQESKPHQARLQPGGGGSSASMGPLTVPAGAYYVLGDNRSNSADSRVYSAIPRHEIVGRSRSLVLSLDRQNYYLPRPGRYFSPLDIPLDAPLD